MMESTPSLDVAGMRAAARNVTKVLRNLANEDRLLLLCQLTEGESSVSELEARLAIHQPTLSQQLGVLRRQDLVQTRRAGKHIYYRISDRKVLELLKVLYRLYCPARRRS